MLYLIGLGLKDENDLSLNSLEIIKNCKHVYLESYTSRANFDIENLEKLAGKTVKKASREMLENNMKEFVLQAERMDVALLIIGDPLIATTHFAMILEARKNKIESRVIHNASIINAISDTGLSMYNFGKIVSIPFENKEIKAPMETARINKKAGMHTLFLLDIKDKRCMSINDGIKYLLDNGMENEMIIAAAGLGSDKQEIIAGKASNILKKKFNQEPACIILPGKMHFIEEEALERWMIK